MTAVTLYSAPVSNYSARARYLIRRKNLTDEHVHIQSPSELGGLKSDEYLKLNPLGKMPAAIIHNGADDTVLFESTIICEYLAEKFSSHGPSFVPSTSESRAKARLIASLLDIYIGPLHPYMYKTTDGDRAAGVAKMNEGFDAVERVLSETGPYAIGEELSIADCCLWGNWPFYEFMLPTFFDWCPTDGRPKLKAWVAHMKQESDAAKAIYVEVYEGLNAWWEKGRWEKLAMQPVNPPPKPF